MRGEVRQRRDGRFHVVTRARPNWYLHGPELTDDRTDEQVTAEASSGARVAIYGPLRQIRLSSLLTASREEVCLGVRRMQTEVQLRLAKIHSEDGISDSLVPKRTLFPLNCKTMLHQTRWTQNPPVSSAVFPCSERIYSDNNNLCIGRCRSRMVAFGGKR